MPTSEVPYAFLSRVLELAAICLFLASLIFLVWAFFSKQGPSSRKRLFVASLSSFLLFVTAFVSGVTLIYFVQMPIVQGNLASFNLPYSWWNGSLAAAGSGLMFASVALLVWAFVRERGTRNRVLLASLCCFLLFLAVGAANYTLLHSIQLPALIRYQLNTSGTLVGVGDPAPDVSFTTLDGTQVRLSELRGKVVLLNFFATWCVPCDKELPHLQKIWDDFRANEGFTMLVIGLKESQQIVATFKAENGLELPMALDPDGTAYGNFVADGRIPRTYLLSRDGTILYQISGFDDTLMRDFYEGELTRLRAIVDMELKTK